METLEVCFLGTSCSTPSVERNLTSTAVKFMGNILLFDCPEGTQRQMMQSKLSYMKVGHIFLSHLHADHILGIPGLVATMAMHDREEPLHIYGPKGSEARIRKAIEVALMRLSFKVECKEVKEGLVLEGEKFRVSCFPIEHGVPALGYLFEEESKKGTFMRKKAEEMGIPPGPLYSRLQKGEEITFGGKKVRPGEVMDYGRGRRGRKIGIVMDTRPSEKIGNFVTGVDLLVHEASFCEDLRGRAEETAHSVAGDVAKIAKKAKVKKLALTHISPRYKEPKEILKEAKKEFRDVFVAEDLQKVGVK